MGGGVILRTRPIRRPEKPAGELCLQEDTVEEMCVYPVEVSCATGHDQNKVGRWSVRL